MIHYTKTYEPRPDIHSIYRRLFERVYSRIYKALRPLYFELRSFAKDKENTDVK